MFRFRREFISLSFLPIGNISGAIRQTVLLKILWRNNESSSDKHSPSHQRTALTTPIPHQLATSHREGAYYASELLRPSLPTLLQIEVESARPKYRQLRRVHRTHHHVLGHFAKVVEDGFGIIDHGDRRHASIHHLTQLHVMPHTGHRQHRAFDS